MLENKNYELWQGDCLELMKNILDKSIDMILCDLPYGTTKCKWDTIIPFEDLWEQYNRIIKDNGAIVLFGSEPFSTELRHSNLKMYKYDWIWNKRKAGNFAQGNKQPLKIHENIMVFYKSFPTYNPQKTIADKICTRSEGKKSINRQDRKTAGGLGGEIKYSDKYEPDKKLPVSILEFKKDNYRGNIFHPTQKPVELLEYLIRTYTQDGEVILDNCMGSGSTGVAAMNLHRKFIGMELEPQYFEIAEKRIQDVVL